MSGIRVLQLHRKVEDKDLRIHFSKPEHGGGAIQAIHYPLFNNDAVILFEEIHTAQTVVDLHQRDTIQLRGLRVIVQELPMCQVFTVLEAQLDDTVAEFLSATEDVRDEIRYHGNLEYHYDGKTKRSSMRGTWYQLEWAWNFLDHIMRHQSYHHTKMANPNVQASTERFQKSIQLKKGDRPIISLPGGNSMSTNDKDGQETKPDKHVSFRDDTKLRSVEEDDGNSGKRTKKKPAVLVEHGDAVASEVSKPDGDKTTKRLLKSKGAQLEMKSNEDNDERRNAKLEKSAVQRGIGDDAFADDDLLKGVERQFRKIDLTKSDQAGESSEHTDKRKSKKKPLASKLQRDDKDNQTSQNQEQTKVLSEDASDLKSLDFMVNGLRASVYTGEIVLAETEAIVNAANGSLANYGGVARAIAGAASPQMQMECNEFVQRFGEVKTTGVMHTSAGGRLSPKVKYILHSVGPVWAGEHSEALCKRQLTDTFLNCLKHSNDQKLASVSTPAISSGIFGCPLELCTRAFLDALLLFAHAHPKVDGRHLQAVHLIYNDGEKTALTVVVLRQLIDQYGFDRLTEMAIRETDRPGSSTETRLTNPRMHISPDTQRKIGSSRRTDTSDPDLHSREASGVKSSHPTIGRPLPEVPKMEAKRTDPSRKK